jgi:hypothetical protein
MNRRAIVVVLAVLTAAAGCKGPPPGKEEFNDLLAAYNRKLQRAGIKFRTALEPMKSNTPVSSAAARDAYKEVEKTLKEVRADFDYLDVPSGSGKAPALRSAYEDFLKVEEGFKASCFEPILQKVEESGPSPAEKWGFIEEQLKALQKEENTALSAVLSAQREYCSEFEFRAMSLKQYMDEKNKKK